MTREEVKEIAQEVYRQNEKIVAGLIRLVPKMATKEVCEFLDCDRRWLYSNKEMFGGKIKNRRGDLEFETSKVATYKRRMISKQ